MARPSAVTYEQVAAVANNLVSAGNKNPSAVAVREELAKRAAPGAPTGSPNTIQRHLDEWRRRERPVDAVEAPQLPAQLAADIARALSAAATHAREQVEEKLALVQGELDELAAVGERNEATMEQLAQDLAARTSERDTMAGQLADRTAELANVKSDLLVAQERVAQLERSIHEAQATAQAAEGRVEEIRASTERQLAHAQESLASARTDAAQARDQAVNAEKRAVGAEARLEGAQKALETATQQLATASADLQRLQGEATRAAAAEATLRGHQEQVALLNNTVEMLKKLLPDGQGAVKGK